jgi:TolB-like protein/Flp pilus assembly protein TadD
MSLISEIRKRNVLRAAVAYAVVSWLLMQIADVLLDAFDAPGWIFRTFIILLATGFPVALILAWFFELTTAGLVRNEDLPENYVRDDDFKRFLNPVIIAMLSAAVLLFALDKFYWTGSPGIEDPDAGDTRAEAGNSLAVLPFANRSSQADDAYFVEGIHDDLLTMLARIDSFNVVSRTSVMRYRDSDKSIPEIGRELHVDYVLEGGVQRAGAHVRVNAQLIEAENDQHAWAETFDRELSTENLFAIQSEIARAIATATSAELSPKDERRLDAVPTTDLAAYEAYLRGRQGLWQRTVAAYEEALVQFQTAISLDQNFAGAYAGLCETHLSLYLQNSDARHFTEAESACEEALVLDADRAEVRVALGALYRNFGDYERAEQESRKALEIEPRNVEAMRELGQALGLRGQIREAETILLEAESLQPENWLVHDALFTFYREFDDQPDRYEQVVQQAMKVVELTPENAAAWNNLGTAYYTIQQYDAAGAAWDRALELKPTRTGYTNRGLLYYYNGQFSESAEMQKKAIELAPDDHRAWGRLAESYRWMETGAEIVGETYLTAARLAEARLEVNSRDWVTRGLLALYYVRIDRDTEAVAMIDTALLDSGRDPETLLCAALIWQELGDEEAVLTALEEMMERDATYNIYIAEEPDLKVLRGNPRFDRLMEQ